jgi:hypothetical protein
MLSQVNYKEFPMNEMAKTLLKVSITKLCIMTAVTTKDFINTNFYSKVIALFCKVVAVLRVLFLLCML